MARDKLAHRESIKTVTDINGGRKLGSENDRSHLSEVHNPKRGWIHLSIVETTAIDNKAVNIFARLLHRK